MAEVIRTETWHCTLGNHYKQYILTIGREGGTYSLTAEWGRIGAGNLQSKIYVDRGSMGQAQAEWNRLVGEKEGKGYQTVSRPAARVVDAPARPIRQEPYQPPPVRRQEPAKPVTARKKADDGEYKRRIKL